MRELPAGWAEAELGTLCKINPRHSSDLDRTQPVSFVPMPYVDEVDGLIRRKVSRALSEVWTGYTHFRDGDVLFAKITPCMENGKIAVARHLEGGVGCGSTEFHVLRSFGGIDPDFVWRILRQADYRRAAETKMTGAVGQRRVPASYIAETHVAVPPLAEQRRIVEKIDALTARSKRARADLTRSRAGLIRLREQTLYKVFDAKPELRRNPPAPVLLRDLLLSLDQGWSPKCADHPALRKEDWAVIKTTAIQPLRFLAQENKALPKELRPRTNMLVQGGDVLITRAGPRTRVGVCCYVEDSPGNLMICDKAYRLKVHPDSLLPAYLAFALNSPGTQQKIEQMKTGGNDSGLNLTQDKLLGLTFQAPPLSKQRAIVARIETAFSALDRVEAEARAAERALDRLDQAILAKAFRGELVPQDPADEPASELLTRIAAERARAPKPARGRRKTAA